MYIVSERALPAHLFYDFLLSRLSKNSYTSDALHLLILGAKYITLGNPLHLAYSSAVVLETFRKCIMSLIVSNLSDLLMAFPVVLCYVSALKCLCFFHLVWSTSIFMVSISPRSSFAFSLKPLVFTLFK